MRKLHDERLREAYVKCPDDGHVLVPTGDMYASDPDATQWSVAFRCPEHPGDILRIWQPQLQPLIDEVLDGVDVESLPEVDAPG